jgi:hypothetical protein
MCPAGRGVSLGVDEGRVLVRGKESEMSVATDGVVEPVFPSDLVGRMLDIDAHETGSP